jgi:hypothetical protein
MKYSREEALEKIRAFLVSETREGEITCQAAARLGIFCRGFDRWSTEQLKQQFPWLVAKLRPDFTREELLQLIVLWDKARMLVDHVSTTCDALAYDHDACLGFDRFSNAELKKLFPQIFSEQDEITQW